MRVEEAASSGVAVIAARSASCHVTCFFYRRNFLFEQCDTRSGAWHFGRLVSDEREIRVTREGVISLRASV